MRINPIFFISILAIAIFIFNFLAVGDVSFAAQGRDPPAPPKRPAFFASSDDFPVASATLLTPQTSPINEKFGAPAPLPIVARSKMDACGHAWREIKREGKENNRIWREFAMECLTKK